jgi:hypothetical protein
MMYYYKQEFEILNPFCEILCDFMGEITCTKCELARKPTMCTVKINFILLIWALSVNSMDMPWVQSLAQSEDYRKSTLCNIVYPQVQQLSQSENCRSSLCANIVCPWLQ